MKIRFLNIKWDTDGADPKECCLPAKCILEVDDDTDVAEQGADCLSDKYGFCVESFNFEEIKP